MKLGIRAFAAAILETPARRNSFTRRSCSVRCARSTRPLAAGVLAQIPSMFSSYKALENCVWPDPVTGPVGLISRQRNKPRNRRMHEDLENRIVGILRDQYPE